MKSCIHMLCQLQLAFFSQDLKYEMHNLIASHPLLDVYDMTFTAHPSKAYLSLINSVLLRMALFIASNLHNIQYMSIVKLVFLLQDICCYVVVTRVTAI